MPRPPHRLLPLVLALVALAASGASAATLELRVEAEDGAATLTVAPGAEVAYRVTGELDADDSLGLALVAFDLEVDGAALPPADTPAELPMAAFSPPLGFTGNPAGFGGTPSAGRLLQVGGAQNFAAHGAWPCILDSDCPGGALCTGGLCAPLADLPSGSLITGLALPGAPLVIATGRFAAPVTPGSYRLAAGSGTATVVRSQGIGSEPFWVSEAAAVAPLGALVVTVTEGPDAPAVPALEAWAAALVATLVAAAGATLLRRRG